MAVGMTLQQIYAQPNYDSSADAGPVNAASSSAPKHNDQYDDDRSKSPTHVSHAQHQPHAVAYQAAYQPYVVNPLPFEYGKDVQGHHRIMHQQYADSYGSQSPHPGMYGHPHDHQSMTKAALDEHTRQQSAYHHNGPAYDRSPYHASSELPHFARNIAPANASPQMYNGLPHSFPSLIDAHVPKKEVMSGSDPAYAGQHGVITPVAPVVEYVDARHPNAAGNAQGASQEAMIKVKTPLKAKYWRNGRRNLQCFPSCKVFGDYSAIKIEDLKQHDFMWGKCRGSVVAEVTLNSNVSFDDLVILGRVHSLENIPVAFEDAVVRECMIGRMVEPDAMDGMKDQWITGERLPDFVQQEGHTASFEFKPKVWKYTEDMAQGKCKRRNVKYYVQFEAFVLVMAGERRYYACIGSGMSSAFEVGSSRVLARQKRKAATSGPETNAVDLKVGNGPMVHVDMMQQPMHHHPHHQMMNPHAMMHHGAMGMYQSPYPPQHDNTPVGHHRGLPPTFPLPQTMNGQQMRLHGQDQLSSMQNQSPQQQQQQSVGSKRKLSSDTMNHHFPGERTPKSMKVMSGAV